MKRTVLTLIAACLVGSAASAMSGEAGKISISAGKLSFEIASDASGAAFVVKGLESEAVQGSDFWRLMLDDGMRTEIPVFSSAQKGSAVRKGGVLTVTYDSLVSDYGDTYPIRLTVTVEKEGQLLKFTPSLSNGTADTRVNECFCPLADFKTFGGEKTEDILYMPNGLGERLKDPWKVLESKAPSYYSHDELETFIHYHYPRATMGWYGVQSAGSFLYVGRHDPEFRHCFLTVRHRIHGDNMMMGIDHFPMARPGETLTEPSTVIGMLDGDWRSGADIYRAWADRNFFKVQPKEEWVKNLTGWQRIIMRSQYGEDYYKPSDLPAMYKAGEKYGIRTLFLFAWWKEGMDRGYPIYEEPWPGAWKELSENIKKVQEMGGRVILECNCHFIDPQTDYYRQNGDYLKLIDINGNEYRPSFVYYGRGEFRETYGQWQFPLACACTQMWRDQVVSQLRLMGDLGADCVFADCYGGCPYQPCFNDAHEHGPRVDEEWTGHRKFFNQALDYCNEAGKVLGTEVVTDIASSYTQFVHGLVNVDFKISGNAFPQLFRYTFPEVITTERNIYSSEGDFFKQLKFSLTAGVRLDAQLWVCRADIARDPKYAEAIKFYCDRLNQYSEFFFDGRFTAIDCSELPYYIKRGEYLSADGKKVMRVLYNASSKPVEACGTSLKADEIKFQVFDAKTYNK